MATLPSAACVFFVFFKTNLLKLNCWLKYYRMDALTLSMCLSPTIHCFSVYDTEETGDINTTAMLLK